MFCWAISIHTPAKGVTAANQVIVNNAKISIHTPAKEVTVVTTEIRVGRIDYLNPHSREGSDFQNFVKNYNSDIDFNPHSREGSDGD